jgi:hypothetical protein
MDMPKFFWFATTSSYTPTSIDPLRGVIKQGGGIGQPFVAVDVGGAHRLIQLCQDLSSTHPTIKYYVYCSERGSDEPLLVKEIG